MKKGKALILTFFLAMLSSPFLATEVLSSIGSIDPEILYHTPVDDVLDPDVAPDVGAWFAGVC